VVNGKGGGGRLGTSGEHPCELKKKKLNWGMNKTPIHTHIIVAFKSKVIERKNGGYKETKSGTSRRQEKNQKEMVKKRGK